MKQSKKKQSLNSTALIPKNSHYERNKAVYGSLAALSVIILFVFAFNVINKNRYQTYEDMLPYMDEAFEFEDSAFEAASAYDEEQYELSDIEKSVIRARDYELATNVQKNIINDIRRMEDEIEVSGGVTSYEDLKKLKTLPVTDPVIAARIESDLEAFGIKKGSQRDEAAEIKQKLDEAYTVRTDVFGNVIDDNQ